jgi:entericidin A
MKNTIQKISTALLLGAFVMGLTACNTMAGVGKDTQKAGEKIEKEAERHTDDKK